MAKDTYSPSDFSKKEQDLMRKFVLQRDDAKRYFEACTKPRLDRAYKLYMSYGGDRAAELKRLGKTWMANIFVPYTHAVVETLMPRILDARPDFAAQGRTEDDQMKAVKLNQLSDYTWEISRMDEVSEDVTRSAIIFGTGYMQVGWKKDVREQKFLDTKDFANKKYKWTKRKKVFYDAPFVESVDNYSLWYDWHNVPKESKQYWFKRLVITEAEIRRKYPSADSKRLKMSFKSSPLDTTDFASIRNEIKYSHEGINKGDMILGGASGTGSDRYSNQNDDDVQMHEVFEWWRPFDDAYSVVVNEVPVFKGGEMPIPYDFKESPFIDVPFLKLPFEFEGVGLPLILESPQIMLNMIKNQRLDSVTLNIHKMWIVNPLANINKEELIVRPFGIIYSADPNGVKEVVSSDIKQSAYKEEEMLKNDMRYASGVDDFSMAVGGGAGSATEIRHLRESTLERVRLFVNHLGSSYATLMRYWISMYSQFFTQDMIVRIVGEDGREMFPIIEKDDLMGEFDFKAAVYPSISGKNDIDKKQGMDLFQLLVNMPFVDPQKLTSKVLHSWNWSLDSLIKKEEPPQMQEGMLPEEEMAGAEQQGPQLPMVEGGEVPEDVIQGAMALLGGGQAPEGSPFAEAGAPINLLDSQGALPPTAPKLGKTTNPRGLNRGGKVNTNIPTRAYPREGSEANQAANIQS